jgi:glycerophosphoryl diester phosphodiesterase
MIVLSHRGFWKTVEEKNRATAFERSFDAGFGTETDVRDCAGKIVIAHDMPRGDEMTFEDVLQIMDGRNLPLALNIKADGLGEAVRDLLGEYGHINYWTFDMSVPDMMVQLRHGLRVFTGLSDIAPVPVLLHECAGVWLDCFRSDWYGPGAVDSLVALGKQVCLVSADLHHRPTTWQWRIIQQCDSVNSVNLAMCTDFPEEARRWFNGED